jgi:hypothetical protein
MAHAIHTKIHIAANCEITMRPVNARIDGIGGVGKRLTPAVLKTVRPERVSWVRIPPPPPASFFSPELVISAFQCWLRAGASEGVRTKRRSKEISEPACYFSAGP